MPSGNHPKEGNCKRIYERYYPDDESGGDSLLETSGRAPRPAMIFQAPARREGERAGLRSHVKV